LVGIGFDKKFSVFAAREPGPAAAKDAHGTLGHLFFPLVVTAEGFVDLFGKFALRFLAWVGEGFPKVGVVGVPPSVVADGGADLGGNRI